jgi:hypothetical protein
MSSRAAGERGGLGARPHVAALHKKMRGGSRKPCRGSRAGFIGVHEPWRGAQSSAQAAAADARVLHQNCRQGASSSWTRAAARQTGLVMSTRGVRRRGDAGPRPMPPR